MSIPRRRKSAPQRETDHEKLVRKFGSFYADKLARLREQREQQQREHEPPHDEQQPPEPPEVKP